MPRMPNGDVLPSHVDVGYTPHYDGGDSFNNFALRFGEVQEIIWPDDTRSRSKKFVEYRVYVQERSNATGNGRMYEGVILMNSLAGLADRSFFTLRGEDSASQTKNNRLGLGSKVLMLCINGETNNAVIIGGLRDETDVSEEKTKAKDLKHHLYWVFNGISVYIDDDGEFLLTYGGKTKADGTTDVDKKMRGTRMAFLKDGSWNINTRDPNDPDNNQEQFIFLDHKNHKTIHQAKDEWQCQVHGKAKFVADDGVHLNDATDLMLLGESHRKAQKQMHNLLKSMLQSLQSLVQTAGAQLLAASTANAVPLVGGAMAAPSFAAAAAALTAAAPLIGQMGQAINTFEQTASSSNDFLSKKHKND